MRLRKRGLLYRRNSEVKTLLICALALALIVPLFLTGALAQQEDSQKKYDKLAAEQARVKEQFELIEKKMEDLAKKLEQKQPADAERLRAAWQAVRERLIVERMAEIQEILKRGEGVPALDREDKLIQELIKLLDELVGRKPKPEEREKELEEIRKQREAVEKLEKEQQKILDETKEVTDPEERVKAIDEAISKLDALTKRQQELIKDPAKSGADADSKLAAEQAAGSKPDSEKAASNQQQLGNDTKKTADEIGKLTKPDEKDSPVQQAQKSTENVSQV